MPDLTATQLRALKPKATRYDKTVSKNLVCRVEPNGTKRFLYRYTEPATGKKKNRTIGSLDFISLKQARVEVQKFNLALHDYGALEAPKGDIKTFKEVATEWLEVRSSEITPRQARDIDSSLQRYIYPKVGQLAPRDITPLMIIEALRPIEKRGALETVKRLCSRVNMVFRFAVGQGLLQYNPMNDLAAQFKSAKRNAKHLAALSPDQLPLLIATLNNANISAITRLLAKWQLSTMTRPGEAANAEWSEIDLTNHTWTIPPEKMKSRRIHHIPLSRYALSIIEAIKPISDGSNYVFPGLRNYDKPANSQSVNMALKRAFGDSRTTAHGLRSLASTMLNESGKFRPDVIEHLLAHVDENEVRRAYNRSLYTTEKREALEWLGDQILNAERQDVKP